MCVRVCVTPVVSGLTLDLMCLLENVRLGESHRRAEAEGLDLEPDLLTSKPVLCAKPSSKSGVH